MSGGHITLYPGGVGSERPANSMHRKTNKCTHAQVHTHANCALLDFVSGLFIEGVVLAVM